MNSFDYDTILEEVGEFGPWQKVLFAFMWIPSAASAMAVFMYEFIAYTPKHRCIVSSCEDSSSTVYDLSFTDYAMPKVGNMTSSCTMFSQTYDTDACYHKNFASSLDPISCQQGYVFDKTMFSGTATVDFEMICSSDWKKSLAQSIYMGGMLIGSFVFGYISDRMGRRTALMISAVILAGGGTFSALLPANPSWFPLFAICRFISGCGHVGMFMMSFNLALEYTGPSKRVFCGCLIETPFALGGLIVGILSWVGVRNWRHLQLLCSTPWILICLFRWIVPESPRWLLAKGKIEQLKKDIATTAKYNNRPLPARFLVRELDNLAEAHKQQSRAQPHATTLDLFRPFAICARTLNVFYNWAVTTLCYYGLTMTASSLSENVFLNFTLLILIEIPAHFFCIALLDKWGRKKILSFCQILSGLSCIIAGFVSSITWLQVLLSLIGKFGATASFTIVFVYTAEMFPTVIRSTAVGSSSTCGRIGGFLAPQVAYLATLWKPLPLIIMGGSALIGGLLALVNLPETLGQKLPETMQEAIDLGKKPLQRH